MNKLTKLILSTCIFIIVIALSLPTLLQLAGLHPNFESKPINLEGKHALIIYLLHQIILFGMVSLAFYLLN